MYNELMHLFKALSDKNRLRILELLKDDELCVTDICRSFRMRQPSISHHLAILRRAGVVIDRKEGKEVYYSINRTYLHTSMNDYITRMALIIVENEDEK